MLLPLAGLVTKVAAILAKKSAQVAATRLVQIPKVLEVAKGVNEARKLVKDVRASKQSPAKTDVSPDASHPAGSSSGSEKAPGAGDGS